MGLVGAVGASGCSAAATPNENNIVTSVADKAPASREMEANGWSLSKGSIRTERSKNGVEMRWVR